MDEEEILDREIKEKKVLKPNSWVSATLLTLLGVHLLSQWVDLGFNLPPRLAQLSFILAFGYHTGYVILSKGRNRLSLVAFAVILSLMLYDLYRIGMIGSYGLRLDLKLSLILLITTIVALSVYFWNKPGKKDE